MKIMILSKMLSSLILCFLFVFPCAAFNISYSYDDAGRLTGVTYEDGTVFLYNYDAAGNFTSVSVTPACINNGDADGNGVITSGDAQTAFRIALGIVSPTYLQECASDCNGSPPVTSGDAQLIFLTALGMGSCSDPL
jgi:YD repeat-containing protein